VAEYCLLNPMLFEHQSPLTGPCEVVRQVVVMDLDYAGLTDRYHRRRAAGVETALKAGVFVTRASAAEFVRLYQMAMARKGVTGRWDLSAEYLEALCGVGTVFAARVRGAVESIALVLGNTGDHAAYYHLAANAGLHPQVGANDLLVHEIALWARAHGFRFLHLGGGVTAATDDPVLFYKAGFSDLRVHVSH